MTPARHTAADRPFIVALALLAAGLVAIVVIRAAGLADYPRDAGPAISAAAHGDLAGFFAHQPAMGPLSLYLRVPFAAVGVALGDDALGVYRWASLPCLIALALVAIWLARFAAARGASRIGQLFITGAVLLSPLAADALSWGHPEEILTAALAAGALLGALEDRPLIAGLLGGLAIASKQWALIAVIPVLLILDRERIRTGVVATVVAAAASVPMMIGNFGSFMHVFRYISRPQPVVTMFTWLYPFSGAGPVHISDINGGRPPFMGHQILPIETALSHPLIMVIGLALPLLVWWGARRRPRARDVLLACALALLLRCALDPGSAAYYHLPLLLTLFILDGVDGRSVPRAGLAGTAIAFVVLDRFPQYLPPRTVNVVYIAVAAVAGWLLLRELRAVRRPLMRSRGEPITAT